MSRTPSSFRSSASSQPELGSPRKRKLNTLTGSERSNPPSWLASPRRKSASAAGTAGASAQARMADRKSRSLIPTSSHEVLELEQRFQHLEVVAEVGNGVAVGRLRRFAPRPPEGLVDDLDVPFEPAQGVEGRLARAEDALLTLEHRLLVPAADDDLVHALELP